MAWLRLFELLAWRADTAAAGWITDPALRDFYAGFTPPPDLFDIAAHYLGCTGTPHDDGCHLDWRETDPGNQALFAANLNRNLLARTPGRGRILRAQSRQPPTELEFAPETAEAMAWFSWRAIETLAIAAPDAANAAAALSQALPYLHSESRALLHVPDAELPSLLAEWRSACVLLAPCPGPDGAAASILCLENLSATPRASLPAPPAREEIRRTLWNNLPAETRWQNNGTIMPHPPPPRPARQSRTPIACIPGPRPDFPVGNGLAMQAKDPPWLLDHAYLVEIHAARIDTEGQVRGIIPARGPVVVDPARWEMRACEHDHTVLDAQAERDFLASFGRLSEERFAGSLALPIRRIVNEPTFVLALYGYEYTHFISEILPGLEHLFRFCAAESCDITETRVLIPHDAQGFLREGVRFAGIPDACIIDTAEPTLFRRLLVAPPTSEAASILRSREFDAFFARLNAARTPNQAGPSRIFVSRRDELRYRNLLNEEALIDQAKARGYAIITTAGMSFEEKYALFSGARAVVGPVGPGMFHAVFARNAAIGVLQPDTYAHFPMYLHHMSEIAGHSLFYAFGTGIASANTRMPEHGLVHSDFVVSPAHFAQLLDAIEARLGEGGAA